MLRRAQSAGFPVCLIEPHPLVKLFLLGLLEKDPSIQTLEIPDLKTKNEKGLVAPILVVDNCALPLPLSECMRRLRVHHPEAKYLILGHELGREDLLRLLWIKIDGFLPYAEVARSLLRALHSVAKGNIWFPRDILREFVQLRGELQKKDPSGVERITAREVQIVELVRRRFSNKEIAEILKIRESTVKFHLSNIYSKLQVSSRHDLVAKGTEHPGPDLYPALLAPI